MESTKKLLAIIVDDMQGHIDDLKNKLAEYCSNVEVIKEYTKPEIAIKEIPALKFDILFLDIEMPIYNGIAVLLRIPHTLVKVIFVSSHPELVAEAFNIAGIHYIPKPVQPPNLLDAISKVEILTSQDIKSIQDVQSGNLPNVISVDERKGTKIFLSIDDVSFFEADNNYCWIYDKSGKKYQKTRTLASMEEAFKKRNFIRVHRSYVVNFNKVKRYVPSEQCIIMDNDRNIGVGRIYLELVKEKFNSV